MWKSLLNERVARTLAIVTCGASLSGCGWGGIAGGGERDAVLPSDGAVEIGGVAYLYDFEAEARPMAPTMMADPETGALKEQLAPSNASGAVPILRIGRADGEPMTQGMRGSSREVASFLCAENPQWARSAPSAEATPVTAPAGPFPDWVSDGRWNLVRPCG